MRIPGIRIECLIAILRQNAYMHEQIRKGFGIMNTCISRFGIRIGDRKYLNEYTPFESVSLWVVPTKLIPFNIIHDSTLKHYMGIFAC